MRSKTESTTFNHSMCGPNSTPHESLVFEHGDRVAITQKYWRSHDWQFGALSWDIEPKKSDGIFLGYRWLSDGHMESFGDEHIYSRINTFKAGLVSINAKTSPVYVPLDAMTQPTEGDAS